MGRRSIIPNQVLALMRHDGRHCWTVDEVHSELADRGLASDPSSVFRAVTRLEQEGAIVRVPIDDRRAHFEVAAGHHDHLVCHRCGAVEPLACAVVHALVEEVRRGSGFVVSDHQLVLTGTCATCQAAALPGAAGDHADRPNHTGRGEDADRHGGHPEPTGAAVADRRGATP